MVRSLLVVCALAAVLVVSPTQTPTAEAQPLVCDNGSVVGQVDLAIDDLGSGDNYYVAFSADGSTVAFDRLVNVANDERRHVTVKQLATGDQTFLLDVNRAEGMSLSANGKVLAVGVRDSGDSVVVYDSSNTGTYVASELLPGLLPSLTASGDAVGYRPVAGPGYSLFDRVTTETTQYPGISEPILSADGRSIVHFDGNGLAILNLVSGTTSRLSESGRTPTISADGRFVAYTERYEIPDDAPPDADPDRQPPKADRAFVHDRDVDGNGVLDEPGTTSTTQLQATTVPQSRDGEFFSYWSVQDLSISPDGRSLIIASDASATVYEPPAIEGFIEQLDLETGAVLQTTKLADRVWPHGDPELIAGFDQAVFIARSPDVPNGEDRNPDIFRWTFDCEDPDPCLNQDPLICYAPEIRFHPNEQFFPMEPDLFIQNSRLRFAHDGFCDDETISNNPQAFLLARGLYDEPELSARIPVAFWASCEPVSDRLFRTDEYTRPYNQPSNGDRAFDLARGVPLDINEGFSLQYSPNSIDELYDILGAGPDAARQIRAPIFAQRITDPDNAAQEILVYQTFFGFDPKADHNSDNDVIQARLDNFITHQGDWERIEIVLNSNGEPLEVRYRGHGCKSDEIADTHFISWDDFGANGLPDLVEGSHPVVFVAEGTHASYPRQQGPGTVMCGDDGLISSGASDVTVYDHIASGVWKTWQDQANIVDPTVECWYGYGGAWGGTASAPGYDHEGQDLRTHGTGPAGPGWNVSGLPLDDDPCRIGIVLFDSDIFKNWFGSITVEISSASPGEQLQLSLASVEVPLAEGAADGGGALSLAAEVPEGTPPGNHRLIVRSKQTGLELGSTAIFVEAPEECLSEDKSIDVDGDFVIDSCDPNPYDGPLADADFDLVPNNVDDCPLVPNADQDLENPVYLGLPCDPDEGHNPTSVILAPASYELPPDTGVDALSAATAKPTSFDALANDVDPQDNLDPSTFEVTVGPAHGQISGGASPGILSYTSSSGFIGADQLTYKICDTTERCALGNVMISVLAASDLICDGLEATIVGTPGDDVLPGTSGADVIVGLGGDDVIDALDGNDTVCAGSGDDEILGGNGNDSLFGQAGADLMRGGPGNDILEGADGNDRILGGIDEDIMRGGPGNDYLGGFGGNDAIFGGSGDDIVFGGFGADSINGGAGNDIMRGLIGNDTINGDGGNDTLDGDRGNDTINGGPGNDIIRGGNANDILKGNAGDDSVSGGRADDTLSGGPDIDSCVGNKHIIGDTADSTCETAFGIP